MVHVVRKAAWSVAFLVLIVFAVPWFLWGSATVVAGLPVWLWWHVGWMGLASLVFYAFSRRAWDDLMGVDGREKRADARPDGGVAVGDGPAEAGDRSDARRGEP